MQTAFLGERDPHVPFGITFVAGTLDAGAQGIIVDGICEYSDRDVRRERYGVLRSDGTVVWADWCDFRLSTQSPTSE